MLINRRLDKSQKHVKYLVLEAENHDEFLFLNVLYRAIKTPGRKIKIDYLKGSELVFDFGEH